MSENRWTKYIERESSYLRNYLAIHENPEARQIFDLKLFDWVIIRHGDIYQHWIRENDHMDYCRQIARRAEDSTFLVKVETFFNQFTRRLTQTLKALEKCRFGNLKDSQLFALYSNFTRDYSRIYCINRIIPYDDYADLICRNYIQEKTRDPGKAEKYYQILTKTVRPSPFLIEEIALKRLAIKIRKNIVARILKDNLIRAYWKKYAGMTIDSENSEPEGRKYYEDRLENFLRRPASTLATEIKNSKLETRKTIAEQKDLSHRLNLPEAIENNLEMIRTFAWMRIMTRVDLSLAHHYSKQLFEEIGKRMGLTASEVKWLNPEEVRMFLISGSMPSKDIILDRKKMTVFYYKNESDEFQEYYGEKAQTFVASMLGKQETVQERKTLKGTVAFSGLVEGKVCVILSKNDLMKVSKGDIIVTRMTTPDFVSVIPISGGIITDEGGITCHASVLAREMKKTCLIGTKDATKVLKDGDLVRIDSAQGEAKIISRSI